MIDDIFFKIREVVVIYLKEYRDEYEQTTPYDTRDLSLKSFMPDDRTRRHAKHLSFWCMQLN